MKTNFLLFFLCFTAASLFAQSDWTKWSKAEENYELNFPSRHIDKIDKKNISSFLLSGLKFTYGFFISDLDGDNCPFYPTCSEFFITSVKETNFFKGSLMFADRFTRDTNIFKRRPFYPLHVSGRLFDPVDNYKLAFKDIIYYPRDSVVK